jgi:ABC-2 type transport system permease protein
VLKQIRLLVDIQTCNLFGLNEFRYTKDVQKKHRWLGMAAVWALLTLILVVYIALFSSGLIRIGLGEVVPEYLFTVTSLLILFFTIFKAGSVIFQMRTYEALISLPVSKTAIVVSRFLGMYITNLLMSCFVMIPGIVLYGIWVKPVFSFYIFSILGTLFLPLLPITIATIIGAFITGISSRMKKKSLVNSVLTMLLIVGFMVFSTSSAGNLKNFSGEMLKNLSAVITAQIQSLYPPAAWFGRSAIAGSLPSFLLFFGVSAALFLVMVFAVQHYFTGICTALNATTAKNNYKMRDLKMNSPMNAMFRRELKRYFASSIYVTNTIIGYILMAAASIALFFAGADKLEAALNCPGLISKAFPLFLAAIGAITTPTSCAISMEGKQWWITKTIPVRSKDIFDSKILMALTVAAPEYLVAVVFGLLAVKPSFIGALWIVLIPAVYIVFLAVAGICVNLAMPVFNWENEIRAVKQSASVVVTMLVGFVSFLLPILSLLTIGNISADLVMLVTFLLILAVTAILYYRKNRKKILYIG